MKIVLDTNIIYQDYKLNGQRILKLYEASKRLGYELAVPEVVVDEVVNQYRRDIESAYGTSMKGLSQLRKLAEVKGKFLFESTNFVDERCVAFETAYLQRIKELGITILPYPKVAHKMMVAKDLKRIKPFKEDSKGYRDALIWETVKEQLIPSKRLFDECQIILLSENTKDFGDGGKLHSDLEKELEDIGFTWEVVELVSDVDGFFKNRIDTEFEELSAIQEKLQKEYKYNRVDLKETIEEALYNEYVVNGAFDSGFDPDGDDVSLFPREFENPDIQDVTVKDITVTSVKKLTDQTVLVQCNVASTASGDAYLFKSDFYLFDEDNLPTVLDDDWNKHYMLVAVEVSVTSEVTLHVSPRLSKVNSVEVRTIEVERL